MQDALKEGVALIEATPHNTHWPILFLSSIQLYTLSAQFRRNGLLVSLIDDIVFTHSYNSLYVFGAV